MKRFLVVFILLFACAVVVVTQFQKGMGPHTSKSALILNRLRAIDAAKEAWAAQHPSVKDSAPGEQDLAPYLSQLHHNTYFTDGPVAGETYLIHSLTEPTEAQLTKQVDNFPANASVRWGPDGDIQVRTNRSLPWPNKPAAGKAGTASRLAVDRHWPGLPEPERWP
jgi:hypothetical protein